LELLPFFGTSPAGPEDEAPSGLLDALPPSAGNRPVRSTLPRTNDTLMTVFSSTVVLQRLALKMSERKARYLDGIGVEDHGIHPDVPKNVSKSITLD
jgi:hypothetical protein